jgi:hypothetical protein
MPEVAIAIGGIRAAVSTPAVAVVEAVRRRYAGFVAEPPCDWALRIAVDPAAVGSGDGVGVTRDAGADRFELTRYDFRGQLDLGRRTAEVAVAEPHELTLDSLLRVMLSVALIPARGLLVHAAGIVRGRRGYLFPGVSGAGKTTVARLSSDATLLSDELSIATVERDGARVHGTPFWGELARPGAPGVAALAGIYFLRQATHHGVTPLGERAALARLLTTVMCFSRQAEVVARVVDLAADLVARVPCFVLDFRRDRGFWEVVERG